MGKLYLVATPIGNLEDVTLRALRVLTEAGLIASEDTRTTRKLLAHHGIRNRLLSYTEHSMRERTPQIMRALESGDVALVSEAGTPGLSDPGYELVQATLAAGHEVSAIPGPAAPIAALAASGLPFREFTFLGFLPRKSAERRKLFESVAGHKRTLVAFESPHRLLATLADALAVFGDRHAAIARELTKLHEEVFRGPLSAAIEHFAAPRGEFTLVIAGAPDEAPATSDDAVREELRRLREMGVSARDAAAEVARRMGLPKRKVYALGLE